MNLEKYFLRYKNLKGNLLNYIIRNELSKIRKPYKLSYSFQSTNTSIISDFPKVPNFGKAQSYKLLVAEILEVPLSVVQNGLSSTV